MNEPNSESPILHIHGERIEVDPRVYKAWAEFAIQQNASAALQARVDAGNRALKEMMRQHGERQRERDEARQQVEQLTQERAKLLGVIECANETARRRGKKAEALRVALRNLCDKLDLVGPAVANAFILEAAHGRRYNGPNYGEELKAARSALVGGDTPPATRSETDPKTEDVLECSVCPWRGYEAGAVRVEDPEDSWFKCPACGEMCAHLPLDELDNSPAEPEPEYIDGNGDACHKCGKLHGAPRDAHCAAEPETKE